MFLALERSQARNASLPLACLISAWSSHVRLALPLRKPGFCKCSPAARHSSSWRCLIWQPGGQKCPYRLERKDCNWARGASEIQGGNFHEGTAAASANRKLESLRLGLLRYKQGYPNWCALSKPKFCFSESRRAMRAASEAINGFDQ